MEQNWSRSTTEAIEHRRHRPPGAWPIDRIQGGRIVFRTTSRSITAATLRRCMTGLSVDIRAGERRRVGLVGRSGSGKTTFVKLVQRLYDVSGGKILIDGQDIAKATQQSLRSQIAIVLQDPILFHRSLAENIAYMAAPWRQHGGDRARGTVGQCA